jgi:cytochrome c
MSAIPPIRPFALATLLTACVACATASAFAPDVQGDADTSGADRGKAVFLTNACSNCHGVTKEDTMKVGPTLFGVVGRKAGTAQSLLGASENLKKYGVTWDAETLDEFLANPDAKVPGTPMSAALSDPQQRADVIAYLITLKD